MDAEMMLAEMVALLDLISEACEVVREDAERGSRDPEVWGSLRLLEDARHKANGAAGYAAIRAERITSSG